CGDRYRSAKVSTLSGALVPSDMVIRTLSKLLPSDKDVPHPQWTPASSNTGTRRLLLDPFLLRLVGEALLRLTAANRMQI
ncbi:hypothetical protein M405DRAFT_810777, partial [Rhizopogon salebrosus TDB-379]